MGSLDSTIPLKRGSLFGTIHNSSKKEKHPFSQRFRSSFSRLLFKKLDYDSMDLCCCCVSLSCCVSNVSSCFRCGRFGRVFESCEDEFLKLFISLSPSLDFESLSRSQSLSRLDTFFLIDFFWNFWMGCCFCEEDEEWLNLKLWKRKVGWRFGSGSDKLGFLFIVFHSFKFSFF
jgi:hypothetical protein